MGYLANLITALGVHKQVIKKINVYRNTDKISIIMVHVRGIILQTIIIMFWAMPLHKHTHTLLTMINVITPLDTSLE